MYVTTYLLAEADPKLLVDIVGRAPDHDVLIFEDIREMAWRCGDLDAIDIFCGLSLLAQITECGADIESCRSRFLALMAALGERETLH